MPGTTDHPVRFANPFRRIVEVGWPTNQYEFNISVAARAPHSSLVSCSGPYSEAFDINLHGNNYLVEAVAYLDNDVPDGSTRAIFPFGGGSSFPCTANGFPDIETESFGAWQYDAFGNQNGVMTVVRDGLSLKMQLLNYDHLDGNPVCRQLALGGRLSAARTGAAGVLAGPVLDFSSVTFTEIGGAARVFRPVAISGTSGSGTQPNVPYFFGKLILEVD